MNRVEHIAWARARALEYLHRGEHANAFLSFISDLGKHDETVVTDKAWYHEGLGHTMKCDTAALRVWIEGKR